MFAVFVRVARVLLFPALLVATGCDLAMADLKAKETAEWRKTYQLQPGQQVAIDNVNGPINVEPSAGNTVEVVAEKLARAATAEGAKEALGRTEILEEISPARIRIETKHQRAPGMFFGGGAVEVRYTVRVPAGADVKFTTVNGGIELTRLTGRITAETVNGGIVAREVGGTIDASTVNGGIDVDLARVSEDGAKLGCTNGGIKLRLPADAKASISASVVNGGIDAEGLSAVETTEKSRRRFEGRLNGGGPRIRIEGTNGGIRIAPR
jgi:hypothetical protein